MSYVAYHKDTTRYLRNHPKVKTDRIIFANPGAAKAAITREARAGHINKDDFLVAPNVEFYTNIEKSVTVTNPMSGKDVIERTNTPWACSVRSDAYWQS
jgi:hypothetical protein